MLTQVLTWKVSFRAAPHPAAATAERWTAFSSSLLMFRSPPVSATVLLKTGG